MEHFINKKNKINLYSSYSLNNKYRNSDGYRYVETTYHASDNYSDGGTPNDDQDDIGIPEITDLIDFTSDNENHRYNQKHRVGSDYYLTNQLVLNTEINYSVHQTYGDNIRTINAPLEDAGIVSTITNDEEDNFDNISIQSIK